MLSQKIENAVKDIKEAKAPITLDLNYNEIRDQGAEALAGAIEKATQPITLYLAGNEIRNKGIKALAEAIERATQPVTLDLLYETDNYTTHEFNTIVKATQPVTLDFHDIEDMDFHLKGQGAQALAWIIENANQPVTLNFSKSVIEEKYIIIFAKAIEKATQPIDLNLKYTITGDEGVKALAEAIEKATQDIDLNLSDNKIEDEGAKALAEAIEKATQDIYIYLDLSENEIEDEGARALAKAINVTKAMVDLNLNYNEIEDEGAEALAEVVEYSPNLFGIEVCSKKVQEAKKTNPMLWPENVISKMRSKLEIWRSKHNSKQELDDNFLQLSMVYKNDDDITLDNDGDTNPFKHLNNDVITIIGSFIYGEGAFNKGLYIGKQIQRMKMSYNESAKAAKDESAEAAKEEYDQIQKKYPFMEIDTSLQEVLKKDYKEWTVAEIGKFKKAMIDIKGYYNGIIKKIMDTNATLLKNKDGGEGTSRDRNDGMELGGEGTRGLKIIEIERMLKVISNNINDSIETYVDPLDVVLKDNQQNGLYTYVLDTLGEDSKYKSAIQLLLKNKEEYHALGIQKDDNTCGDNGLILLSEFNEKEGVKLGISYVTVGEKHHAVAYIKTAIRNEEIIEVIDRYSAAYKLDAESTNNESFYKKIDNASYSTSNLVDLGKLDILATSMLLNEHLGSDVFGTKESQYTTAIILAITSSTLGYQAGAQSFYIPIVRAGIFTSKDYMSNNLEAKIIDVLNQHDAINHYNPGFMSIAVKTVCNIAISLASPSFTHTFAVNTLSSISNQLDAKSNSEHAAVGGVIATKQLLENYTAGDVGKTYYESASLVLGAFYVGKIATQLTALGEVEFEMPDLNIYNPFNSNSVSDL
jgi:Ran GTPase-activating protein (RanGAP) involved in mRNA processing and transport